MRYEFSVRGTPGAKGSSRAMIRGGKPVNVPGGSGAGLEKLKAWNTAVRDAAAAAVGLVEAPPFVSEPIRLTVIFRMARPKGHFAKSKKGPSRLSAKADKWPAKKPDIDKLMRSTCDALTGVVYDDDSRICEMQARKTYAAPGEEGAWIRIERIAE